MKIFDSVGNEIIEGAILRWKHFRTRTKKYYMYKQMGPIQKNRPDLSRVFHLPYDGDSFSLSSFLKDGKVNSCVVVYANYEDFRDIKRNPKMRD